MGLTDAVTKAVKAAVPKAEKPSTERPASTTPAPATTPTRDAARAGTSAARTVASPDARERRTGTGGSTGAADGERTTRTAPPTTRTRAATSAGAPEDPAPAAPPVDAASGGDNATKETKAGPPPREARPGSNARTNPTPAGTRAAELDAAVPEAARPAAIEQQEGADAAAREARLMAQRAGEDPQEMERAALDTWYDEHPTYVDPQSNEVYAASYDPATGELTLTRNDMPVQGNDAPTAPPLPVAPLDSSDDDYWPDEEAEDTPGRRSTSATGGATHRPSIEVFEEDAHEGHGPTDVDAAPPAGGETGTDGNQRGGGKPQQGGPQYVADQVIVIAPDGSRVVTTNTALATAPRSGEEDFAATVTANFDDDGRLESRTAETERTRSEDGGTVAERTRTHTVGSHVTSTWETEQAAPNGDRTVRRTERESTRGTVTSDMRTTTASAGGVTLHESQYTDFSYGRPDETTIVRSGSVEGASRATHYKVDYDDEGFPTHLTGDDPVDGREPIDAWVAERLGPLAEGATRPAFGPLRDGGDSTHEDRTVRNPVYVAELGLRTIVDGVDVFIEGDSIAASDSVATSVAALRDSWAGMPERMRGAAATVDLLSGRSTGDRGNSNRYEDEFFSGASAVRGGDHMTYYLDNDPNRGTTRHEYAHLSGVEGGSPDEAAWIDAMEADQATGVREDLGELDDESVRTIEGANPLLTDEIGATSYGNRAFGIGENENEDFAESIELYLASRENGGLVQVRGEDGSIETYTFEELYPNRARILDAYYELGPAPEVPAPEWEEEAPARGDGSIFDKLGEAGAAAAGAAGATGGG